MKRIHIHITVDKFSESIGFYSTLFGTSPVVERQDYAKWSLSEPAVNFAISKQGTCGHTSGINHLGIQVDSESELKEIARRLDEAEISSSKQKGTSCCHTRSNKHWVFDPQGIAWESFHSLGDITNFGGNTKTDSGNESSACCIPLNISQSNNNEATCCVPNNNDAAECC